MKDGIVDWLRALSFMTIVLLTIYQLVGALEGFDRRERAGIAIPEATERLELLASHVREGNHEKVRAMMTPALRMRFSVERLRTILPEFQSIMVPVDFKAHVDEKGAVVFSRSLPVSTDQRRVIRWHFVNVDRIWQIADFRDDSFTEIAPGVRELERTLDNIKK